MANFRGILQSVKYEDYLEEMGIVSSDIMSANRLSIDFSRCLNSLDSLTRLADYVATFIDRKKKLSDFQYVLPISPNFSNLGFKVNELLIKKEIIEDRLFDAYNVDALSYANSKPSEVVLLTDVLPLKIKQKENIESQLLKSNIKLKGVVSILQTPDFEKQIERLATVWNVPIFSIATAHYDKAANKPVIVSHMGKTISYAEALDKQDRTPGFKVITVDRMRRKTTQKGNLAPTGADPIDYNKCLGGYGIGKSADDLKDPFANTRKLIQ